MKKILGVLYILPFLFFVSSAYSATYDYNDGTSQGWISAGLYDGGTLTPLAGTFASNPAPWFDGQNSPGAPPGFDPLHDNIGSTGVGSGGFTYPVGPSTFWGWYLTSPNLSGNADWQGATSITADITGGGMAANPGNDIWAQFVLYVEKPDLTKTYFTDGVFHQIPISLDYNQSQWITYTLDVAGLNMPAGTKILNTQIRIFGESGYYDGYILLDNVTSIGGNGNGNGNGTTVPEPATLLLLGLGLVGLAGARRKFQR